MMQLSAISEVAKGYIYICVCVCLWMMGMEGLVIVDLPACVCVREFLCRFRAGGVVHIHMEVQVRKSNYKCINLSQNAESRM